MNKFSIVAKVEVEGKTQEEVMREFSKKNEGAEIVSCHYLDPQPFSKAGHSLAEKELGRQII